MEILQLSWSWGLSMDLWRELIAQKAVGRLDLPV